ncbi:hypothetical protein EEL31_10990 [Brevibacillus laterosporus]|uniref:Copper amine oxidase n=1 Tax=Brevibacillus laterosporus TaxID=1465 RepID=A0A518VDQ8_BRELA|nr:hypothetical protein [Brevibacillus laterosporus]QDX95089.1 hypothetical protein EEL30_24030 [Brevibacillus laterosporus]TPG68999.1 hypothetical protein EEL31_10990 [Brevibacillus laterosporus]
MKKWLFILMSSTFLCGFSLVQPIFAHTAMNTSILARQAPSDANTQQNNPFVPKPDLSKQDVWIQLNSEPRIHSPLQSLVSPNEQEYTLFFRETMERQSVEDALRKNVVTDTEAIPTSLSFSWVSDVELKVGAKQEQELDKSDAFAEYQLQPVGAKTKSGHVLTNEQFLKLHLKSPEQMYKLSLIDNKVTVLTEFTDAPASMTLIGLEKRFLLKERFLDYCYCDGPLRKLGSIYDINTKTTQQYPIPLDTTYIGKGDFIADTRGFFYETPKTSLEKYVPKNMTAHRIQLPEYVHGASFTKDYQKILLALGTERQVENFDLGIYDLKTKKLTKQSKALLGTPAISSVSDSYLPITFEDLGNIVLVYMNGLTPNKEYRELPLIFDWKTQKTHTWMTSEEVDFPSFQVSDDGTYKYFYYPSSVTKDDKPLAQNLPEKIKHAIWLPNTTTLAFLINVNMDTEKESSYAVVLHDVDQNKSVTLPERFKLSHQIQASPDGKEVYMAGRK